MTPIQIILILALLILLKLNSASFKNKIFNKVAFIILFNAGILVVIFPETTNWMANLVGVERGADLLTYLLVLIFYASFYYLYSKMDKLNIQQTKIIRELAIRSAKKPIEK